MINDSENLSENFFENEQRVLEDTLSIIESNKELGNPLIPHLELMAKNYKKILKQSNKLLKVSDVQQSDLKNIQNNLKNLLDNAKQGFLSFKSDLKINKEYSAECERILGQKIENKKLSDILFYDDEDKRNYFRSTIQHIFSVNEHDLFDVWFRLLPLEVVYDGKFIKMDYAIIELNKETNTPNIIMVILTDISEQRKLEKKMEEEKKILQMVVACVTNYSSLLIMISEYKEFSNIIKNKLYQDEFTIENILSFISREIHTFKGNFAQLDFFNTANKLEEFENIIHEYRKTINNHSLEEIKNFFSDLSFEEGLNKDFDILKNILGQNYFKKKGIMFIKTKLIEIEQKIAAVIPQEQANNLLYEIRQLRNETFISMIKPYVEYTKKLADRMSKIVDVTIDGNEKITVDTEKYYGFIKSLVHVFRNSVDHGIEDPEDRHLKGKDYKGNIKCSISLKDGFVALSILDDGRGIEIQKIKEKAISKNMYTQSDIQHVDEKELLLLVFCDQFSTRDQITDISGRGVGLHAVKTEVEKIGGKIDMHTEKDKGTEIIFYVPLIE